MMNFKKQSTEPPNIRINIKMMHIANWFDFNVDFWRSNDNPIFSQQPKNFLNQTEKK